MIPEILSKLNPQEKKLRIVRLTPPGRGAVATVLLHGMNALDVFLSHWHGPGIDSGTLRQYFGRFQLDDIGAAEEVVVYAPHEDEVEIHSHGGEAVVSAIESMLVADGATPVSWKDFFCPGNTQKERAMKLLTIAPTERTAQILLDQYNGALEREWVEIERLTDLREKQDRLNRLEENARFARHLVEPFRVVLAGPVNAGKSSLLNAVLGFRRAIVNSAPGTTRDSVSGRTALDGFPVEFIDTAGFRPLGSDAEHDLELQGIRRSEKSIGESNLVLWVVDVTNFEPKTVPERENLLLCLNKIDLLSNEENILFLKRKWKTEPAFVSAEIGEGLETLLDKIVRRLVPNPPRPLEGVPLTELAKFSAK